jgi:hypothetical protein
MRASARPGKFMAARGSWRRWLGPAVLAAAVSAAGGAHADDDVLTWIVKSISADDDGDIIQASAMRVPQVGTALVTGQQIATGAGQHMVLVNGRDLVEIRPNSTVMIGDDDASTAESNVSLVNGTIHVEVGKRAPGKTFSIDAPYLVATVKGTQFEVSSSSAETSVSVTEGVVAVSSDASGASVDVTVGKTAVVGQRNADKPKLSPTDAGSTPSTIEGDKTIVTDETTETASADNGGNTDGSDSASSNSGGSNSGGSNSGGSDSGGNSGGSDSGGSGGDSGGSDSGSGSSSSGSGGVGGAVGDATGAVGGAVGGAADAVGDTVSDATGALGGAVGGPVGDAVSGVGGAVGGAVSGVGGAVGGAVGGLGGALGGLLGGGR